MDSDEEELPLLTLFGYDENNLAFDEDVCRSIENRRAQMSDVLIFDILLSLGGIKVPDSLYPPRDFSTLRRLLNAIETSTYDAMKKDGLIYFLLKWHTDGRDAKYQHSRGIPPQFVSLADAYWYLDSGENVARAVSLLSDARINRDYTSKILQAISLDSDSQRLILKYIRTAKPLLTEPDDIDAYSIALAESSLFEAWQYQRTFADGTETRARLLRNILTWCLTPNPRSKPLTQLLSFPLSNYEQTLLHGFALQPPKSLPSSCIPVIRDLACVRLIQGGQYAAAVKLDRQFANSPIPGKLSEQARRVAQDRSQTMEEILAVMPAIERQLLEEELDEMPPSQSDASSFLNPPSDLGMSWEQIPHPWTNGVGFSSTHQQKARLNLERQPKQSESISHRSGAPRFGGPSSTVPTGASTSFTAVREMFDSLSSGKPPVSDTHREPGEASRFIPLAASKTELSLFARVAPANGIPRGPSIHMKTSSPSKYPIPFRQQEPVSLFDHVGSANSAPNAFYQPPAVSKGTKRPFQDVTPPSRPPIYQGDVSSGSAFDVSAMLNEPASDEEDVQMHESDGDADDRQHIPDSPRQQSPVSAELPEFSFSVFQPSADSGRQTGSHSRESTPMVPPGAFQEGESEDGSEHAEEEEEAGQDVLRYEELRSASSKRPTRPTRIPQARKVQREVELTRSIPGSFMDEEEEDVIAPLPSSTPSRRPRKSRAAKDESTRPIRRSSRLSVMSTSERGSSSPEPILSPEKPTRTRKSTGSRTPAAGAPSRSTRSRKQR